MWSDDSRVQSEAGAPVHSGVGRASCRGWAEVGPDSDGVTPVSRNLRSEGQLVDLLATGTVDLVVEVTPHHTHEVVVGGGTVFIVLSFDVSRAICAGKIETRFCLRAGHRQEDLQHQNNGTEQGPKSLLAQLP